ncbi:MAG: hypothetical protein ACTSQP_08885 [Promethearchaeota archaeon]
MTPIISLQVSDELHERFEKVRLSAGFNSKSEALRESIIRFIEFNENIEKLEGYKVMNINLVYPFKESIIDELADVYSQFSPIIKSISDWRIAEKKIEIILAVGEIDIIKGLYQKLSRIKDVSTSIHEIIIE